MPSTFDVTKWPVQARIAAFEAFNQRVLQDLSERYPASQGYVQADPLVGRESARLTCMHKITRGNDWGLCINVDIDITASVTQCTMRFRASRAVPSADAAMGKAFGIAVVIGLIAAGVFFSLLRDGYREANEVLMGAACGGMGVFFVAWLVLLGIFHAASGSKNNVDNEALSRDIAALESEYNLPSIFSDDRNEYFEIN